MPSFYLSLRPHTKYALSIALCLLLITLAASAHNWLQPARRLAYALQGQQPTSTPETQTKELLPSEDVTITSRGFEPAELTRPAGNFFLTVENRSGQRGLTIIIASEQGTHIREFTQPEDELDWSDELQLPAGSYTLTTAEHPDWVCHITLTSQ